MGGRSIGTDESTLGLNLSAPPPGCEAVYAMSRRTRISPFILNI